MNRSVEVPALALVTGATGFVGSHLVDLLLARGYRVRCLVRATSDLQWLPTDHVELAEGEVTRPESLGPAVRGADFVFHCAGVMRAPDPASYERVNTTGTRNLVEAALREAPGLARFVHLSSLAAGGSSTPDRPRSEDDPDLPTNAYGRSKLRSEAELEKVGLSWTVFRPGAIYGPRDRGIFLIAQLANKGWAVRVTGPDRPVQLLHVRDLVRGMVEAAESPRAADRRYYMSHPQLTTWDEVGRLMAAHRGSNPRVARIPGGILPWVSRTAGWGARLLGKSNPLPSDRLLDLLAPAWTCDTRRAEAEWGFKAQVELRPGIEETVAWYREHHWL